MMARALEGGGGPRTEKGGRECQRMKEERSLKVAAELGCIQPQSPRET